MTGVMRLGVLLGLLGAVSLQAAEVAHRLADIRLPPTTLIYVRTVDGSEVRGRFVGASDQALSLVLPDGRSLSVEASLVVRVWRQGDGLGNGAIIGGLLGLAGGIFGQSSCTRCGGEIAVGVGLGVPLWAAVGALIDRQHEGRTLVYVAP